MKIFLFAALIAYAAAAPSGAYPEARAAYSEAKSAYSEARTEEVKPEPVPILKQINQLNDDGSYTFGFEAGDGSFRVETRDISGHIRGKYGYIDENGEKQVLEYVSGKDSGRAVGFQPSGVLAPFPIVRAEPSEQQRVLDYQYSSVDLDEDGQPDFAPALKSAYSEARSAYPEAKSAYPEAKSAYPEAKTAYPVTKAAYPEVKTAYAAPEPAVVKVEVAPAPVVVADPAPAPEPVQVLVPVVPAPEPVQVVVQEPVKVVHETVQLVHHQAPVLRAPLQFAPAPLQFAPAPVQFAQFPQQIFRVNHPSQTHHVVDQQFLEDLQNQSVDADEDGQPDQAVQIVHGPSVQLVPGTLPAFGARLV